MTSALHPLLVPLPAPYVVTLAQRNPRTVFAHLRMRSYEGFGVATCRRWPSHLNTPGSRR